MYVFIDIVITGREALSVIFYSLADFSVFRLAGAPRCTDQGEIWQGGADRRLGNRLRNFNFKPWIFWFSPHVLGYCDFLNNVIIIIIYLLVYR